ncbi:MAG: hypothetical protein LDLANPLL_00933 [Turneriella sp.]|nr:hypothetical protein [Turneriella sp.]
MTTRITVSATVNAPVEKVWERYTAPDHITKWNFASDDWQCPWAKNDLKVGGKYAVRMEAKDKSFGFEFEAVYDIVDANKELTYTMTDGRKATTTFQANGSATRVETTFDAETENSVELQKGGWQAILDNFKKYVEGKSA